MSNKYKGRLQQLYGRAFDAIAKQMKEDYRAVVEPGDTQKVFMDLVAVEIDQIIEALTEEYEQKLKKMKKDSEAVLLKCTVCDDKPVLCTRCGHNRWVARQLGIKFGQREDLPLKRE